MIEAIGVEQPPRATYRLQLTEEFGFAAAGEIVDYLATLGVSHLYLSPVLTASAGSTHGYDVADPGRVSDVLGGEEGLRRLADRAHERGVGLVVDIVPNHVGIGADNPLWDALLAGEAGADRVFDVDWAPPLPGARGKVVLPVLGDQYGRVLHAGELTVEQRDGRWRLRYYDHDFPLATASREVLPQSGDDAPLSGVPGEPDTWTRLHALLEAQRYRLVHWRAGDRLINYRRFFAIDELAAVRVEEPDVFEVIHAKVLELVEAGVIDGLRVDHPDGLRDPGRYLRRLAERTGGRWIVVEKIRERHEALPPWPVAGTTGYEFTNDVLALFVDPETRPVLDALDAAMDAAASSYRSQVAAAKHEKLAADLAADLRRLGRALWQVSQAHLEVRDVDDLQCRQALADVLTAMDVYRTYVDPETGQAEAEDVERIHAAVERARTDGSAPGFLYDLLAEVLTGRAGTDPDHREVLARFQQLSAAVMAKGVEDTVFYRYRRLLAVNEVGGDPSELGLTPARFHELNSGRGQHHPAGLLSTATHDTKRGEDVRLRMAALSEMAERWSEAVVAWRELNRALRTVTHRGAVPDAQTEYLLYQTLVGVWPLDRREVPGADLVGRVQHYLRKALREAGQRTTWTDPDEEFEAGVGEFVADLLDAERSPAFLTALDDVVRQASEIAMVAGLAQTLLRCTAPGVPDTYQGNELWDDSLVDPDNRRPVDFPLRRRLLDELDAYGDAAALLRERRDGRVKLWVLSRALRARRDHREAVGTDGRYVPLDVTGRWADHLVAFARVAPDGDALLVVTPRLPGRVMGDAPHPPLGSAWADTAVALPDELARPWSSLLTGERHDASDRLPIAELLATLPVALCTAP